MKTSIEIKGLKMQAFHGALAQERIVGNLYRIDLTVWMDFSTAMLSDDLNDTINYALLADVIKSEMLKPSQLLEHVAGRIVKAITSQWPVIEDLDLTIAKLCPPIEAEMECAAVHVKLK